MLLQTMRDTVGNSDLSRDRRRAAAVPIWYGFRLVYG